MKACFVDTSALYAAMDSSDEFHKRAVKTWEKITGERRSIITSNYVIVETTALIQSRLGLDAAIGFSVKIVPMMQIEWVDEETHKEATTVYLLAGKKRLSLVDCTSFIIMRKLMIGEAFAFDRHFSEQGFILA